MIEVAQAALECWGLADAKLSLAAARENHVFRVHTADGDFALRVHRRGYRSDAELNSELDWMTMVAAGDQPVDEVGMGTRPGLTLCLT